LIRGIAREGVLRSNPLPLWIISLKKPSLKMFTTPGCGKISGYVLAPDKNIKILASDIDSYSAYISIIKKI